MFGSIRRAFGMIKVTESSTDINVEGVPAEVLSRDISKIWGSSNINTNMFTRISRNGFSFPKFFALEIHYMLGQLDEYRYARSSLVTLRNIQHQLETNTWMKSITEEHPPRLDLSLINDLTIKLMPHQEGFLQHYNKVVTGYGLRGYLLSADPGTGKTFMGLALSHTARSDITVIVSPKNALDSVWVDSIKKIFKKPVKWWKANSGIPYAGEPYIIANYEAINKALDAARHHTHSHACVILDESHNLNEAKSNRTQGFLELCKVLDAKNVLWSSGSPLKALGYEMVPLLRSIDPLFNDDVEHRFVKIFGKETGRALDILRTRIGKISFHVAASAVVQNSTTNTDLKITLENGNEYTIDAVRTKMKAFMEERLEYYRSHFKQYRMDFEAGVAAYRQIMPKDQAKPLDKYLKDVTTISNGYDAVAHKEQSLYVNYFEKKVLIPGIPDKAIRDAFKNARSVVKYYPLRAMGEALGNVLGKARVQCHMEMIKKVDWRAIIDGSEKKVLIFSSYVDVVKAVDTQLKSLGYEGIVVMGETNKNVAPMIKELETNGKLRYCVATYASLSTAVPVTMCNTEVLTNVPWRSFELKQAKARIDRLGQNGPVHFFYLILNTGNDPNISTRSHEILEWSREMVQKLMGTDHLEPGMARVLNNDFLINTNEQYTIGLESDNAFQVAFDEMFVE